MKAVHALDHLEKLQKRYTEVARVDFFESLEGRRVSNKLRAIEGSLRFKISGAPRAASATAADFKNKHWITRPHPHVDRLACTWLIRRFIDPKAVIRYGTQPEPDLSDDQEDEKRPDPMQLAPRRVRVNFPTKRKK